VRPWANFTPRLSPREVRTTAALACTRSITPTYYAAFVVDLDGHRIEAVCHAPEKGMIV
jgi:hypothetical protein